MAVPIRILFVEDNPDDARVLQFELEASGYGVTGERVQSRLELEAALAKPPLPDIILADYTMPRFSALGVLEALQSLTVDVPVVVVTGTVGEDRAVECMRQGAADYLLKDRLARLGPAVRRALEQKRARDEKNAAERELQDRLKFDALLTALSTELILAKLEDMDAAILDVFRTVSASQGFDGGGVALFDGSENKFDVTHEWLAPGIRSAVPILRSIRPSEFGWPVAELLRGESVLAERDTLPTGAAQMRRIMAGNDAEFLCLAPLRLQDSVMGVLWFGGQKRPATAAGELLRRMGIITEVVANTLARKRAEEARRSVYEELERLKRAAEQERDYLREELRAGGGFREIVSASAAFSQTLSLVDAVAKTKSSVLIRGESGVGKEIVAYAVHERSSRAGGPLVKVNCASIPKELFESEFFGHVRGSFTGAHKNRAGRFELADNGTIFLDEIGEIPLDLQSKLLRVLQENEFERIGDERTRKVDVRIVAATNRDLKAAVDAGTFRADLFYRLNVFPIDVPPLRERKDDIVPLAELFLRRYSTEMGRQGLVVSDAVRAELESYAWPGNVRELQHAIQRAVILSPKPPLRLDLAALPKFGAPTPGISIGSTRLLTESEVRELERQNLVTVLEHVAYRIAGAGGAAELLGVNPSTLRDRMKAFGIQRREG